MVAAFGFARALESDLPLGPGGSSRQPPPQRVLSTNRVRLFERFSYMVHLGRLKGCIFESFLAEIDWQSLGERIRAVGAAPKSCLEAPMQLQPLKIKNSYTACQGQSQSSEGATAKQTFAVCRVGLEAAGASFKLVISWASKPTGAGKSRFSARHGARAWLGRRGVR